MYKKILDSVNNKFPVLILLLTVLGVSTMRFKHAKHQTSVEQRIDKLEEAVTKYMSDPEQYYKAMKALKDEQPRTESSAPKTGKRID